MLQVRQVVLDLLLAQLPESRTHRSFYTFEAEKIIRWGSNDAWKMSVKPSDIGGGRRTDFDSLAIHLSFYGFFEGQKRNVHCVFQFQAFGIPLLQEGLRACRTLADRGGLPGKVTSTGVDLVQAWAALQDTTSLAALSRLLLSIRLGLGCLLRLRLHSVVPARYQQ